MKTDEIRSAYLNFFAKRGHKICPSDSLVPGNDPTLLFTGAGMNQFKDQFLGLGNPDFCRATTAQKCIRTGDIMNVGVTPSHHTFFEMMGNFSFGDYFKKEAIEWAWELLTVIFKIPENKLQVSVYQDDDEAFGIWHKVIGLPENLISRLGEHDNFWPADAPSLGPNGPCGPCSEIFYDRGQEVGCAGADCGITCECRRYVEIWNLVFTQFDRQEDGSLPPLPQKNIDTGMGLERMAACLQGVSRTMDIDIFQPLTAKIAEFAAKKYNTNDTSDTLIRRIADHARAVTFCLADGVLPANSHRGYILKRLLRRAALDGRNLGIKGAFLHKLVPLVSEMMGTHYREVSQHQEFISQSISLEEEKFLSTLSRGLSLIDLAVRETKNAGSSTLAGQTIFELYDTYGFPYELAEEVVTGTGLSLDRKGFENALAEARQKARAGAKMKGDIFAKGPLQEIKQVTRETCFQGYDKLKGKAKVLALVQGEQLLKTAQAGAEIELVLEQTVFYGESGGQVGDVGIILGAGGLVIEIQDTQKVDNLIFHSGIVQSGIVETEIEVNCEVEAERRDNIKRNHTATHLLHWALRQVLGKKAEQKGSWVGPDRLRFDFQHNSALSAEQIEQIEELINLRILENNLVEKKIMTLKEAQATGAMALFGEKYGDEVRLISIGNFSKELCGGCHVNLTGEIGSCKIITEESVAAGIRRIEASTGMTSWRSNHSDASVLTEVARELKVPQHEVIKRLQNLQNEHKQLRKELNALHQNNLAAKVENLIKNPGEIAGIPYLALELDEVDGKELRSTSDRVGKIFKSGVTLLAGKSKNKVSLLCLVSKDLVKKGINAGDIVKQVAVIIDGSGGGRADLAQAGGKNTEKLSFALEALPEIIKSLL